MTACTDPRIGNLLHAWETGLLSEAEQDQFETHLFYCDSCFRKAQDFLPAARLMQVDPDVRAVVEKTDPGDVRPGRRRSWHKYLPVSLATAAALLLAIIQPWEFRISPTQEAIAAENRVTVLYFQNLIDPSDAQNLEPLASNLLTIDLAQQDAVEVVSSLRLYDIARSLGMDHPRNIEPKNASRVARQTRSRWILTGSIIGSDSGLVLTGELVETATGAVAEAFRTSDASASDLFAAVDDLSGQLKHYFSQGEPVTAVDPPVAKLTSASYDAYLHYLQGVDYMEKVYPEEAINSFQSALQLDPGMAMAYYQLSRLLDRTLIDEAMAHLERAGRVEQHYIRAAASSYRGDRESAEAELRVAVEKYPSEKLAWYYLGDLDRATGRWNGAVASFAQAIKLDSGYKVAYNALAYAYQARGDLDSALWAIDHYVALSPDEANPYDTRGEMLGRAGRLDEAITSFGKAVELNPEFGHAWAYLGYMYTFDGQYARADSCFQRLTYNSVPSLRRAARVYMLYPWMRQGRFDTALAMLDRALDWTESRSSSAAVTQEGLLLLRLRSMILFETGDVTDALAAAARCVNLTEEVGLGTQARYVAHEVKLLLKAGHRDIAGRKFAAFQRKLASAQSADTSSYFHLGAGLLDRYDGSFEAALAQHRRAVQGASNFTTRLELARTYRMAGELDTAISGFESLTRYFTSPAAFFSIEGVKLHYNLGQIYEQKGDTGRAISAYVTFLDLWSQASPELGAVADASARLAVLRDSM